MPLNRLTIAGPPPLNATPDTPPTGYYALGEATKTNGTYAATNNVLGQACWLWNTVLTGSLIKAKCKVNLLSVSGQRHGPMIVNQATGIGFQVSPQSSTELRIYASVAGQQSGVSLYAATGLTVPSACSLELWHNTSAGTLQIAIDGVAVGTTYASGVISNPRGGGYALSDNFLRGYTWIEQEYGQQISTITDPAFIGSSFSWTGTFVNDIASITAAGLSATGINNTTDTATFPAFADGQVITVPLPATGVPFTFTDTAANTADIDSDVDIPAGYAMQEFFSAVNDDPKYLGYYTDIQDAFRAYYPTANGLSFDPYGRISADSPMSVVIYKHCIGDGDNIVAVTLNLTSGIVGGGGGLTSPGLVSPGLVARGLVARGL